MTTKTADKQTIAAAREAAAATFHSVNDIAAFAEKVAADMGHEAGIEVATSVREAIDSGQMTVSDGWAFITERIAQTDDTRSGRGNDVRRAFKAAHDKAATDTMKWGEKSARRFA